MCGAFHYFASERNDPCARVQNDRALACAHFHAGCISTVFDRPSPGRGITPAYSPKFDLEFLIHGITSAIQLTQLLSSGSIISQGKFSHASWEVFPTLLQTLNQKGGFTITRGGIISACSPNYN